VIILWNKLGVRIFNICWVFGDILFISNIVLLNRLTGFLFIGIGIGISISGFVLS